MVTHQRVKDAQGHKDGTATRCGVEPTVENQHGSTYFGQRVTCPACLAARPAKRAPRAVADRCPCATYGTLCPACA